MRTTPTTPDAPKTDTVPGVRARVLNQLRSKPARRHNPFIDAGGYVRVSPALASGLEGTAGLGKLITGALAFALILGTWLEQSPSSTGWRPSGRPLSATGL